MIAYASSDLSTLKGVIPKSSCFYHSSSTPSLQKRAKARNPYRSCTVLSGENLCRCLDQSANWILQRMSWPEKYYLHRRALLERMNVAGSRPSWFKPSWCGSSKRISHEFQRSEAWLGRGIRWEWNFFAQGAGILKECLKVGAYACRQNKNNNAKC